MRYFARATSTVGAIFLVDSRRINVDKCQVLLRQCADGRGDWGGQTAPCANFHTFLFLILLHTYIYFAFSEHNNLPNTTYALFFCSPLTRFCCSAVFVRNANMGTLPYPAEQQTLKDNSELRKSFLMDTCVRDDWAMRLDKQR